MQIAFAEELRAMRHDGSAHDYLDARTAGGVLSRHREPRGRAILDPLVRP
jgi:hypothetical protein